MPIPAVTTKIASTKSKDPHGRYPSVAQVPAATVIKPMTSNILRETEADIERYKNSAAHKEIVSHTRAVKGASALVKLYDLVN